MKSKINTNSMVVIDKQSGTYMNVKECWVVDFNELSEDEIQAIEEEDYEKTTELLQWRGVSLVDMINGTNGFA